VCGDEDYCVEEKFTSRLERDSGGFHDQTGGRAHCSLICPQKLYLLTHTGHALHKTTAIRMGSGHATTSWRRIGGDNLCKAENQGGKCEAKRATGKDIMTWQAGPSSG
jgi:hypothetical protein